VSFHQIQSDGKAQKRYETFLKNENRFNVSDQPNLDAFVQEAYNELITLLNQLDLEVNFNSIHINLFFTVFDKKNNEQVETLIKLINAHKSSNNFSSAISLRCYSILTDGEGIVNGSTLLVKDNIDKLKSLKKDDKVLDEIIIVDDKNIRAVFLGKGTNYLTYALKEIVLALMVNEYATTANLQRSGVLSFGLGMVLFDPFYFKAFMKARILKSKLFGSILIGDWFIKVIVLSRFFD